ncbi:MAG: amidase family protein [Ilumatobacteraceae bacterium]
MGWWAEASQGRISLGPFRDESNVGRGVDCVSRSVRDTAALLDAVHGPGRRRDDRPRPDPPVPAGSAPTPAAAHRPAGPPPLRRAVHDDCAAAARHAAGLLASLGHTVEEGYPDALRNQEFARRFGAMWSTNMGVSFARIEAQLGRSLTPADVEPVNWVQAEFARQVSGVDYALGLAANVEFRRAVQQWWADGWDLLLTPTLGEPPTPIGTFANNPEHPMAPMARAAGYVPFTPAFNSSGQPAINLPLYWNADGLPIGVQLVAAYGREDVLLRVAAQLEAAQPWADRRPSVG